MEGVASAVELFGADAVERGRRYHRPLYLAALADTALSLAVLVVLVATPAGDLLREPVDSLSWWLQIPAFCALILLVDALVRLPLVLWSGWSRERRWGLSTQPLRDFLADRAKVYAVGTVLTAAALTSLAALARRVDAWPAVAAVGAAAFVLLLGFVAPVVLEPLFNRFRPLEDGDLLARLHALAERAGVPVRDVLVADASRRTAKLNAYVSGVGRTRRVVVFDTLLDAVGAREVGAVVAHELGHRRHRHVAKLTALGMAGAAAAVIVLWLVFGDGVAEPVRVPAVLLVLTVLQIVTAPFLLAVLRRYEREADGEMLALTDDPDACETTFRRIAAVNVADLDPPAAVRLLRSSHPSPPERISAIRARVR
jgi:STE24 endopeptidase